MCYSIASEDSFNELILIRSKIIRILDADETDFHIPIVVVGNKSDLKDTRQVQRSQLDELKQKWKCSAFETSAKEKVNIDEPFYELFRQLQRKKRNFTLRIYISISSLGIDCILCI